MNPSHFFLRRPIFAAVLSVVVVIFGLLSYASLPVSSYPEVTPPTIVVRAAYPGATPETIADTVATPLEQEINGVEGMLYLESQSTADGAMQLTVTFELGTDIDEAQVQVQNRVAIAEPRLPPEVRQIGITTKKSSPDLLLVVHMISPGQVRDSLYLSNYVELKIRDELSRIQGVGDVNVFGSRKYAMRVWLDADRLANLDLTPGDVVGALRRQNVQVAAGTVGQPPAGGAGAFQLAVSAQGRLRSVEEFEEIVVRSGADGRVVRLRDLARVELGAQDYSVIGYLDQDQAVALVVNQQPDSNALEASKAIQAKMEELAKDFPEGIEYRIVYNPTEFIEDSIDEVYQTLLLAALLVVLTVFVFLQKWGATLIPVVAIPISLIGTFAIMAALGLSLNNLSLFGLVLAIGIVVDDAIVVVENVERLVEEGLDPYDATAKAMAEVSSALVATTLVLVAVFVPTAFMPGISGRFYQQFALTIAGATVISTFVSLTLSPAMAGLVLKRSDPQAKRSGLLRPLDAFFAGFNSLFEWGSSVYARLVAWVLRFRWLAMGLFGLLLGATWVALQTVPTGFVPPQDQGYLIAVVRLPDGSSLERTDRVTKQVIQIALETPGVRRAVGFTGFSGATRTNASNEAAVFLPLEDAAARAQEGLEVGKVLADIRGRLRSIQDAFVFVLQPPPVRGIGTGGGFKLQLQDRAGVGYRALEEAAWSLAGAANQSPGITQVFSNFSTSTPRLYADVDRTKAQMLGVPIPSIFESLQAYLGSIYVNDFNLLGRTYRVTVQADGGFRDEEGDIPRLRARNQDGETVPLGSVLNLERRTGPARVVRYNLYPAADVNGDTLPWFGTGEALEAMERLAQEKLPPGIEYEWTDLAYQAKSAGNTAAYLFPLCVLLAFLALAAQYESWSLPLAVVLIVPLCVLFGLGGAWLRGMDNNILVQVGLVVLVGLACKNAILIVEFAKVQEEEEGLSPTEAAIEACRLRLRPVLMTAFSFILGVLPLYFATGAGWEMRRALGTTVLSGMLGVTGLGLFLTPVFYVVIRGRGER